MLVRAHELAMEWFQFDLQSHLNAEELQRFLGLHHGVGVEQTLELGDLQAVRLLAAASLALAGVMGYSSLFISVGILVVLAVVLLPELLSGPKHSAGDAAGGKGTRLKDRLNDLPKPMIPIGGRPLLDATVASLAAAAEVDGMVLVANSRFFGFFLGFCTLITFITAGMPSALHFFTRSGMRVRPSSREYSEWQWRWTKDMGGERLEVRG